MSPTFKSLFSLLLIVIFLLHIFSKELIYLNYYLNKDYIANTLCKNKDKPKMHCEGKCHLNKQLEQDEKNKDTPNNSIKKTVEIQLFSEHLTDFSFNKTAITINENKIIYMLPKLTLGHLLSIFRPPCI